MSVYEMCVAKQLKQAALNTWICHAEDSYDWSAAWHRLLCNLSTNSSSLCIHGWYARCMCPLFVCLLASDSLRSLEAARCDMQTCCSAASLCAKMRWCHWVPSVPEALHAKQASRALPIQGAGAGRAHRRKLPVLAASSRQLGLVAAGTHPRCTPLRQCQNSFCQQLRVG